MRIQAGRDYDLKRNTRNYCKREVCFQIIKIGIIVKQQNGVTLRNQKNYEDTER